MWGEGQDRGGEGKHRWLSTRLRGMCLTKGGVSLIEELYLLTEEHKYINLCLSHALFCSFVLLSKDKVLLPRLVFLTKEHKYINLCLSCCLFCSFVLLSKDKVLLPRLVFLTKEHKYINLCLSRCLFCSFVLLSKNFVLLSKDKVVLSKDLCSFVKIKSLHFKDYRPT